MRTHIRPAPAFFRPELAFQPSTGVPQPAPYPFDHRGHRRLQPSQRLGAWQSVAPEEMKHAFLRAIARGIDASAETCVLERWRRTASNCTAELNILAGDGIYFEALTTRYAALSSTAYQHIFEIVYLPVSHERLGTSIGPKAFAQACNEHARLASKSEEVSGAAALNAHDKASKLQPVIQAARAKNSPTASQTPSRPAAKLHM